MHDPKTVAHEIPNPFGKRETPIRKGAKGDRPTLITIWHVDPEKDGSDDSCGWFMRDRHLEQEKLQRMIKDWKFEVDNNYYFDKDGNHLFSAIATTMKLYNLATWIFFDHDRKKRDAFMRKHLHDIIYFADNYTDSLRDTIYNRYGAKGDERKNDILRLASIVYADVSRKARPWYKHPKWHFWHWELQVHPWQRLKRRYWDKCSKCGKRGFKGAAFSDWNGTKLWHENCDNDVPNPPQQNVDSNLRETV